jgi:hypothetical protein
MAGYATETNLKKIEKQLTYNRHIRLSVYSQLTTAVNLPKPNNRHILLMVFGRLTERFHTPESLVKRLFSVIFVGFGYNRNYLL